MSVIHSARTWAATPKMQPSFNPAGYMLVEGNQYASLQCTFWQIPLRIPGNECMFIDSLDFRPEILSPWFYKLLSGNCSASLRGCKAPWKIIEMKSIKICKLLLLFLSASSPRVWSVQRQRQAAFMSTAIMFQHGVLSYMRTMALGKFFFYCLKLPEFYSIFINLFLSQLSFVSISFEEMSQFGGSCKGVQ